MCFSLSELNKLPKVNDISGNILLTISPPPWELDVYHSLDKN